MSIKKTTITESLVRHLRKGIITNKLAPGQRLNELSLAASLQVSTAPLREALRILEREHLVVNLPRKGSFVTMSSMDDCQQLFKVRENIERCAIDLLESQRLTSLPAVRSALQAHENLLDRPFEDERKLMRENNRFPEFHIKLVEAAGNTWLARLYHGLIPNLARYPFMSYLPGLLKDNWLGHKEIERVIRKGGYDEARESLKKHISLILGRIEDRDAAIQQFSLSRL